MAVRNVTTLVVFNFKLWLNTTQISLRASLTSSNAFGNTSSKSGTVSILDSAHRIVPASIAEAASSLGQLEILFWVENTV